MKTMKLVLVAAVLAGMAGCSSTEVEPDRVPPASSPGPSLTVERFLQAANGNDLNTMMELFGTADRTIVQIDGQSRAERRMHVLATLLHHDDFAILSQEGVAGRLSEATRLQVQLTRDGKTVVVPHLVVRKRGGGWVIEKIDVEKLTQGS